MEKREKGRREEGKGRRGEEKGGIGVWVLFYVVIDGRRQGGGIDI